VTVYRRLTDADRECTPVCSFNRDRALADLGFDSEAGFQI
jgi:hypothetical protein